MNIDKRKILEGLACLAFIIIICVGISKLIFGNSMTLSEYNKSNPSNKDVSSNDTSEESLAIANDNSTEGNNTFTDATTDLKEDDTNENLVSTENMTDGLHNSSNFIDSSNEDIEISSLIGATLNGTTNQESRVTYTAQFYSEPLSDNLCRYITGVSYPTDAENTEISYDDLAYVHVMHYNFDGNPSEGELICNKEIAQDLLEIFYELYVNEYQIESIRLIDEYDGDDTLSMEANNTSCFNYRTVEGSTTLSKHSFGLAIDINPFYNPYVTYNTDNTVNIAPIGSEQYADRTLNFPYKIDTSDLCYSLFIEHGFLWGGSWNSMKDYQHFQKNLSP